MADCIHLGRGTDPTTSSWNEILSIHRFFDVLAVTSSAMGQAMGHNGPWYIPFLVDRIERCGCSAFSHMSWPKANGMCSNVQKQLDEHVNH